MDIRRRLIEAVRSNSLGEVREILREQPELARLAVAWDNEPGPLHRAVIDRLPEMTRLLIESGADPRAGIYPNTNATAPLTLAEERGYDEIAAILREFVREPPPDLWSAMRAGDEEAVLELLRTRPELAAEKHPRNGWTPLYAAAACGLREVARWLLDHGAEMTPPAGVLLGDAEFLQARHAEGALFAPQDDRGWLLRLAVDHDRPDLLEMLLGFELDPDARVPVEGDNCDTWGMPLYQCARTGKHEMAEMLLARGADPNGQVYASGTPLSEAYGQRDERMIALLERYGGKSNPSMAGLYRRADLARRLLAEHGNTPLPDDGFGSGTVAEQLIGSAARGGDPAILRLGMEGVDWPQGDPRWFGALAAPLGFWNHWIGPWCHLEWDRTGYLECFRMILERCGSAGRRLRFGTTILHGIVTMGDHVTAEERVAFAEAALDAGAPLDARDDLLESTPLGWACRWGREELVRLFLARGADPVEADAPVWARPVEWARKKGYAAIAEMLRH